MHNEKMNEKEHIIQSGPLKGKKITFDTTTGIDKYYKISKDFMKKIFDFEPGDYLITDESSLCDFSGLEEMELTDIQNKIRDVYDSDVSDIKSGNLLEIFMRIHKKIFGAPL